MGCCKGVKHDKIESKMMSDERGKVINIKVIYIILHLTVSVSIHPASSAIA